MFGASATTWPGRHDLLTVAPGPYGGGGVQERSAGRPMARHGEARGRGHA